MGVQGAGILRQIAAPDGVQDLFPGKDHIRIGGQQGQHIKFLRRQADLVPIHQNPAGDQINIDAIPTVNANDANISYDRANKTVSIGNASFASVYNTAGQCVMSSENNSFDISSLSAGIYVIKAGNSSLKIVK